jgi:Cys-rich protein (TIGR01571 family)
MVEVVAPSDLSEGFKFNAVFNGTVFSVNVPEGVVKKGDKLTVPFNQAQSVQSGAVTGKWRDGLCDCFSLGICHPSLWNAWCFPLVLLGQVMTRLKLDWIGGEAEGSQWKKTFCTMILITGLFMVLFTIFSPPPAENLDDYITNEENGDNDGYNLTTSIFAAFLLFITFRVRKYIRMRDHIPEEKCGGCEDFCCAFCCGCCVVAQMARHTADYKNEKAECCSSMGIEDTRTVLIV